MQKSKLSEKNYKRAHKSVHTIAALDNTFVKGKSNLKLAYIFRLNKKPWRSGFF